MPLTPEQIALRRTGIAASEVAAVAGLHPYIKPIDVWSSKLGLVPPFEGNEATKAGESLEPYIADFMYRQEHAAEKVKLTSTLHKGDPHGTLARKISDRFTLFATPDRFVWRPRAAGPHRIVQAKNVGLRQADRWGEDGTDIAPEEYVTQCAAELAVIGPKTGIDRDDLAVLIGGQSYREYPQKRDLELEGQLIEICEKFWVDHVLTQIPPPVDGSQNWSTYLKRRFPRDERPMLTATEEMERLVCLLKESRKTLAISEENEMNWINRLKDLIGDAGGIEEICTWRQNRPSIKTDWEQAFRSLSKIRLPNGTVFKYLPDLVEAAEKHTTIVPGARVFRLLKSKE